MLATDAALSQATEPITRWAAPAEGPDPAGLAGVRVCRPHGSWLEVELFVAEDGERGPWSIAVRP